MEIAQSFEQAPIAVNVTVSRRQRRPREYLTEREIEKLMDAARKNRWGHRDATAILIGYRHGLRASAFLFPFGGPGDLPPCSLHRPFGIAGDWQGFPVLLERARHRRAWCIGNGCLCMGLYVIRARYPSPSRDNLISDDCLVCVHSHMLDHHCLLASATVAIERFGKKCESTRGLVGEHQVFGPDFKALLGVPCPGVEA